MPKVKAETDPRVKQFIDFAYRTYQEKTGRKMMICSKEGGKIGGCVQRAMEHFGDLGEMQRCWKFFLDQRKDQFLMNSTKDIPTFCAAQVINRIQQLMPVSTAQSPHPSPLPQGEREEIGESVSPINRGTIEAQKVWAAALDIIKGRVLGQTFETWFPLLKPVAVRGRKLILSIEEDRSKWLIEDFFDEILKSTLVAVGNLEYEIIVSDRG